MLTAAWPQPYRSGLYINNGDVMQTAAVRIAAVCLGHNTCVPVSTDLIIFMIDF